MELVGTSYYFTTQDGKSFKAYGPGYEDTCWSIRGCKRELNSFREEKKAMGL